jgi:pyruvate formate lyase activating enzyme
MGASSAGGSMKATIFNIKRFAIHDGPGIRTTVFFKGCPLACRWCHNPEGQRPEPEVYQKGGGGDDADGAVVTGEPETVGEEVTLEHLVREVEKERIFYEESGGGVTASGGEPLMQAGFLCAFLDACRERGLHTAVDTCGYAPAEVFDRVAGRADLFLYDLKIIDGPLHERYTGASNDLILRNLRSLAERGRRTFIRFTIIPGITDTEENVGRVVDFVGGLKNIEEVDLLPFYNYGSEKYQRLGREDLMAGVDPPGEERMEELRRRFGELGVKVGIGG